ncbi:putative uncharacterized protein DDB_G0289963 isoform X1 [Actinia tenebrosa]|uniref:Uncharacterized protein n=1 Tax=Actinia tenebrosa TaxID=6105 RepID=A0A6P8I8D8_ACTTE|nr:putative uncharacterized protein DDB_G0289963 isoform X1 [Actinia tenebrosa]
MRLSLVLALVILALIVICESKPAKKHSKSKDHAVKKSSKPAKENHSKTSNKKHETTNKSQVREKKGKIAKPKKEKPSTSKINDKKSSKAKDKTSKSKTQSKPSPKAKTEIKSDKSVKIESNLPKENLKNIPKNCDNIVQQYADGQMVMYEYKIKMARCLKADKSSEPSITSKYESNDGSNEDFFRKALKYTAQDDVQNDDSDSDNDNDKEEKKSEVPTGDFVNTQQSMDTSVPQQQTASYYPSQDQSTLDQAQAAPAQTDAAFSQNTVYNQAAPVQQNYNYYARSNIPAAPQAQDPNQQSNAANFAPAQPQVDATKKDTLPAAPASDPFAQFMNIQSSSDTAPQPIQQRSDIPDDQSYNTIPDNQQAYFRQQYRLWSPEDDGIFPENP